MTGEPLIDYEALTQTAMRSVVKTVLARVATTGLPGEHHFYISFDTQADGVAISKRLKAKYPQEMTVVLQHRFWDLNVHDDRFEVKLTFDGIAERLVIPYQAIKVFFDPSVRYGLQFEEPDFNSDAIDKTMAPHEISQLVQPASDASESVTIKRRANRNSSRSRNRTDSDEHEPGANTDERTSAAGHNGRDRDELADAPTAGNEDSSNVEQATNDDGIDVDDEKGADIVSLDAFRKK